MTLNFLDYIFPVFVFLYITFIYELLYQYEFSLHCTIIRHTEVHFV